MRLSGLTGRVLGRQGQFWASGTVGPPPLTAKYLDEAGIFPNLEAESS